MNAPSERLLVAIVVAAVTDPSVANAWSLAPTPWELSGLFQNVGNPAGHHCLGVGSKPGC